MPACAAGGDTAEPSSRPLLTPSYDILNYADSESCTNEDRVYICKTKWRPLAGWKPPFSVHTKQGKEIKRHLTEKHIDEFPWLAYSKKAGGFYCRYCVLFHRSESVGSSKCGQKPGVLLAAPLTAFAKLKGETDGVLTRHQRLGYHQGCVEASQLFVRSVEEPSRSVDNQVNSQRFVEVQKNRAAVSSVAKTVIFCGRNGLPLRGHRDDGRIDPGDDDVRDGVFRGLIRFRAEAGDESLRDFLKSSPGNATYMSKTVQNNLVSTIGSMIQQEIVKRANASAAFAIMVDETRDVSSKEQMCLCVRYVHEGRVREDFVAFVDALEAAHGENLEKQLQGAVDFRSALTEPKLSGHVVGNLILKTCEEVGLSMDRCVGQGYDGAAGMSSQTIGASAVVQEKHPLAAYTHCASHSLNLAVVSASRVGTVRNMYGTVKEVANFFDTPKRSFALKAAAKFCETKGNRSRLVKLCETRWVERHDALMSFIELYDAVVEALAAMSDWDDPATRRGSAALLTAVTSVEFVVTLFATADVMSVMRPLSVKMQGRGQDLAQATHLIEVARSELQEKRANVDEAFREVFDRATSVMTRHAIEVRVSTHKKRPQGAPLQTPEEFYRVASYIPLLDEIVEQLERRFSKHVQKAASAIRLVPSSEEGDASWVAEFVQTYQDLLDCSVAEAESEVRTWQHMWRQETGEKPTTLLSALGSTDPFPIISKMITILVTLPVTSAEAERSFSTLRSLKTWLRSTMTEERLTGLALMRVHPDLVPAVSDIVTQFATSSAKRLRLTM